MAITSWRRQEAEKQMRARDANESTAQMSAGTLAGRRVDSFVCECGDRGCTCAISLTLAEYKAVRAYATHFAIAPDHENPESERVIAEGKRFALIETVSPEATQLARRSDPRWGHEPATATRQAPGLQSAACSRAGYGRGLSPPAKEGTTRDRKPGRAADLTSVDKRRRSSRWLP